MKKILLLSILLTACLFKCFSQTGSFTATFISADPSIKPVTISFSKPLFKFDDSHGYWMINPYTGARHLDMSPPMYYGNSSVGFITINEKINDIDLYALNDSDAVSCKNDLYAITMPEWDPKKGDDNKPMHLHFTTFTDAEVAFTISGTASLLSVKDDGKFLGLGKITGSGHFYREPKYSKTDVLPGCDCDPTIYATYYDAENNLRTTSACENALGNKIFDAVQKSMAPVFAQIGFHGTGQLSAGDINIDNLPGCVNLNVPVKDRPYCSTDYYHMRLTGFNAQKKYYNNEDGYGLRCIEIPDAAIAAPPSNMQNMLAYKHSMDSLEQLILAKKISSEQATKAMNDLVASMAASNTSTIDYKKEEIDHNLYIKVLINPDDQEAELLKMADKNKTVVRHTVAGTAFDILSPAIKESDGEWITNKCYIYLGNFTQPVIGKSGGGFDAEITKPQYPLNGNKLSVYAIIVKLEGSKELIDRAIATIDFSALQKLITK